MRALYVLVETHVQTLLYPREVVIPAAACNPDLKLPNTETNAPKCRLRPRVIFLVAHLCLDYPVHVRRSASNRTTVSHGHLQQVKASALEILPPGAYERKTSRLENGY
jgi:hypothetical protein